MIGPIETFVNECEEHLTTLEEALLELETNHTDSEQIDRAFRAMHTIKGAGGMFGFQYLSDFTHYLETAFDKVRQGEIEITTALPALCSTQKIPSSNLYNLRSRPVTSVCKPSVYWMRSTK